MAFRQLNAAPNPLAFGDVEVGQSSDLVLTIENDLASDASPNITGNVPNPSDPQFTIISGGGAFNLAQGATKNVTVRFTPTSVGAKAATISITHDGTSTSPLVVNISGTGRVYTTTIAFPEYKVITGDIVKLTMVLTRNDGQFSDTPTLDPRANGIEIAEIGEQEWSYDIEEFLLVPGMLSFTLLDVNLTLHNYFFSLPYNRRAQVTMEVKWIDRSYLYAAWTAAGAFQKEFVGYVLEEDVDRDWFEKELFFTCAPQTNILNEIELYDSGGGSLNPLGYTGSPYWKYIKDVLLDIFKKVNPDLVAGDLTLEHDWNFKIFDIPSGTYISDIPIDDVEIRAQYLFFDSTKGLKNLGDCLRSLAIDFCAMTGMVDQDRPFFKKLFTATSEFGTLKKVLDFRNIFKQQTLRYIKTTFGADSYEKPGSSAYTTYAGAYMSRDCLYIAKNYPSTPVTLRGHGGGGGTGEVDSIKDLAISGSSFWESLKLIAEFWWKRRSTADGCRTDYFMLPFLRYDFTKTFDWGGKVYQPLLLRRIWSEGVTEIEAIITADV